MADKKIESQCSQILDYLMKHENGLTAYDALYHFHCMRLAARISDLRGRGYVIETVPVQGANYCRYKLLKEERNV